jgi:hypothetical protein
VKPATEWTAAKRHLVVDTVGLVIVVLMTAASV